MFAFYKQEGYLHRIRFQNIVYLRLTQNQNIFSWGGSFIRYTSPIMNICI